MRQSVSRFLILSIDGGGIRGAFAARMVELISRDYPLLQEVNLLAGTSTGSIIASCLALKFPPSRVVALYRASGKAIFTKNFFFGPRILEKALKSSYDKLRFKAILRQVFGKATLKDTDIPLCLPVTNLQKAGDQLFRSYTSDFPHLPLYEAVLASCSAPTFFDPSVVDGMLLADGGMWGNNPSLVAMGEAQRYFGQSLENLRVLSIGTGHFTNGFDENTRYWGLISGWKIRNLTEFISSVQSEGTNSLLENIVGKERMLRLNFSQNELIRIDSFNELEPLIAKADVIYRKNRERILTFLSEDSSAVLHDRTFTGTAS